MSGPATDAARRLAATLGVDLDQVAPTGKRGTIIERDVRRFVKDRETAAREAEAGREDSGDPDPEPDEDGLRWWRCKGGCPNQYLFDDPDFAVKVTNCKRRCGCH